MTPADLEGCWTNLDRGADMFEHDTLELRGPAECTLSHYQGGDCGGRTHSFSGPWSIEGDTVSMNMTERTEAESGTAGHRNYETTEPCDLTVTARVVREGGEVAIRLHWQGRDLTLFRRGP